MWRHMGMRVTVGSAGTKAVSTAGIRASGEGGSVPLPDFRPYDEPFNIPIDGPMQCQLCKHASVEYIGVMSYGAGSSGAHVFLGCGKCVRHWLVGPIRQVTYNGLTVEECRAKNDADFEARRQRGEIWFLKPDPA